MRYGPTLFAALALVLPACSWSTPEPNVLVIVVDNLRADAVRSDTHSPNLDRLKQCGLVYRSCFAHTPSTVSAQATLFSGRLPHSTGITTDGRTYDDSVPLLAERLSGAGYQTLGAAGTSALRQVQGTRGLTRGFTAFETPEFGVETATETNRRLFDLLDRADTERPWFLFAHYADPVEPFAAHGTSQAKADVLVNGEPKGAVMVAEDGCWEGDLVLKPGRNRVKFRADAPIELHGFRCDAEFHPIEPTIRPAGDKAKEIVVELKNDGDDDLAVSIRARVNDVPERTEQRRRYFLEVEAVDRAMGALLEQLHARNEFDNTLILLTSNHGTSLGQHAAKDQRGYLYDEIVRVPLIVKLPRKHDAAADLRRSCNQLTRLVDVTPTILDLLDLDALPSVAGRSLADEVARELTAEVQPPLTTTPCYAKRNDRFKLIYSPSEERFEMFDLSRDPLELDNVFAVEGHLWVEWQNELRSIAESTFGYDEEFATDLEVKGARVLGY
jgi:arylsulfatase A-like enzyme